MTYQDLYSFEVKKEYYFFWLAEVNAERRREGEYDMPKDNNQKSKSDYCNYVQSALSSNNVKWLELFAPHLKHLL